MDNPGLRLLDRAGSSSVTARSSTRSAMATGPFTGIGLDIDPSILGRRRQLRDGYISAPTVDDQRHRRATVPRPRPRSTPERSPRLTLDAPGVRLPHADGIKKFEDDPAGPPRSCREQPDSTCRSPCPTRRRARRRLLRDRAGPVPREMQLKPAGRDDGARATCSCRHRTCRQGDPLSDGLPLANELGRSCRRDHRLYGVDAAAVPRPDHRGAPRTGRSGSCSATCSPRATTATCSCRPTRPDGFGHGPDGRWRTPSPTTGTSLTRSATRLHRGAQGPDCFKDNRATLHLHGGITPWISDGTPHQWITPADENTPYPQGVSVANVPDMVGPDGVPDARPKTTAARRSTTPTSRARG